MPVKDRESGQVLLIIVLVATVLLTIGLSISQISNQEQKVTKLEEDSKRAFSAAEAGLDAALKLSPGSSYDLAQLQFSGISGTAVVSAAQVQTFHTPLIAKDDQYSLYMADYDPNQATPFQNYVQGNLFFYLDADASGSCSSPQPAIELTFISDANAATKKIIYSCVPAGISGPDVIATTFGPFLLGTTTYNYRTTLALTINTPVKLIIMRDFLAETKIGISSSVNLPYQGKTITSTANTSTGVTQKVELFQSLPQIPASFYVTSF